MRATLESTVDPALQTLELVQRWLVWLDVSGRGSTKTQRNYRRAMIAFLADTLIDLRAVTEDDVVDWLAERDPRGGYPQMVLRALRSFYAWLETREPSVDNPVRRLPSKAAKYGPAPSLSPEELGRVLAAADHLGDLRARPTLTLLYFTGARVGSMAEVRVEDIQRDGKGRPVIAFRVVKGDRPYAVPVEAPEAVQALQTLLDLARANWHPLRATRRPTLVGVGPATIREWANRAGMLAGLRVFPHLLRHTFATRLAEDPEVSLIEWVTLMNHRDGSQLRRYAAASDHRLRSAAGRLST